MKTRHWQLALLAPVILVAAGFSYLRVTATGVDMTKAADRFVKSLSEPNRAKALMAYEAPQRLDWHFIPKPTRKGLQIKEMSEPEREAARALLAAALSEAGNGKATKIMQLESILRELEKSKVGAPLRDPERYFFTLFGEPRAVGRWALSIEGHHLSLNFVIADNKVVSSTPTFMGANPGVLLADYGPEFKKGLRVLAKEEELAYQLLASLSESQRAKTIVAAKAPADVRDAGLPSPPISPATGLAASEMTPDQVKILRALIEEYANNLPADLAKERLTAIEKQGYEEIKFCWAGPDKPGSGHDYRVQGSSFLIEFNNTQPDAAGNLANHVHSVWHNLAGNFDVPAGTKTANPAKP